MCGKKRRLNLKVIAAATNAIEASRWGEMAVKIMLAAASHCSPSAARGLLGGLADLILGSGCSQWLDGGIVSWREAGACRVPPIEFRSYPVFLAIGRREPRSFGGAIEVCPRCHPAASLLSSTVESYS